MSDEIIGQQLDPDFDMEESVPFHVEPEEGSDRMLSENELHDLLAQSAAPAGSEPAPDISEELSEGFVGAAAGDPRHPAVGFAPAYEVTANRDLIHLFPGELAARTLMAPVESMEGMLVVMAARPVDSADIELVKQELGVELEVQEESLERVVSTIRTMYGAQEEIAAREALISSHYQPGALDKAWLWVRRLVA